VFAAPAGAADPVRVAGIDAGAFPELRVTVVAPAGSPQPTLVENGRPATGVNATNLGRAKSVVLAVDRSRSMAGEPLADAIAGARAFVSAAGPGDRLEVVTFGRTAVPLTRFSASRPDTDAELAALRVDPQQGTALWDAIILATGHLGEESGHGRVLVVLTDGSDMSSSAGLGEAIAAAQRAGVSVHAIGIPGRDFEPEPLRDLASRTGGGYHEATSSSQLVALYERLSAQLARTWELRYPTAARPGEELELTATVAGAGSATKTLALSGETVGSLGAPPNLLPASAWRSPAAPFAVSLAVGLLVLLACLFWYSSRVGSRLRRRLDPHVDRTQRRGPKRERRHSRGLVKSIVFTTERTLANVKQFRALQRLLVRADIPLRAAELLYVCLGCGLLLLVVGGVLGLPSLLLLVLLGAGAAAPLFVVKFKAGMRVRTFDNQLPDILIGISASLKAGHSFRQAVQSTVDEGAEPASKEFGRVLAETRLGRPMDDALSDMAERVGSKNLAFVVTAVTIQRQIGGSLAGLFDMVSETVRQRQQFARKIRGLTAMGRMSAWVLTGLPIFLALAITAMNPTYMAPLYTTSIGHQLIMIGVVMIAIGTVILKRIVAFKG
jgi:tight adherence protein B